MVVIQIVNVVFGSVRWFLLGLETDKGGQGFYKGAYGQVQNMMMMMMMKRRPFWNKDSGKHKAKKGVMREAVQEEEGRCEQSKSMMGCVNVHREAFEGIPLHHHHHVVVVRTSVGGDPYGSFSTTTTNPANRVRP